MIYLIRHGQTVFNVQKRHQGWVDSDLTELGRQQAYRAGLTLLSLGVSPNCTVFTSPLGRAAETAQIISDTLRTRNQPVVDHDLKEIGMGSWEGKTEAEFNPEATQMSLFSPDGESIAAVSARLQRSIGRITRHSTGSRIIVSHGVAGRVIRANWLKLDPSMSDSLDQPQDAMFSLRKHGVARIPYLKPTA